VLSKTPSSDSVTPIPAGTGQDQLVQQGELALEEGRIKQAELYAMEALDKSAKNAGAQVLLGKVRLRQERFNDGLKAAEQAISLNDKNESAYMLMGEVSYELFRKTQGRLKELRAVQGDAQDITRTQETLTRHYRNTVAAFRQVTKVNNKAKDAYDRLGDVYYFRARNATDDAMRQSAYWDAIEAFKAASEIGTITYKEAFRIGIIHYRRKEFEPAVRYFQRGIEVCPADRKPKECLWYLSDSYEKQGRFDDALLFWKRTAKAYDPGTPAEAKFHSKALKRVRQIEARLNN
jgi:tetratricopeptide (TPR) repeat protein